MDKEKLHRIELFHQPQLKFLDAFTGKDILHPTHQVVTATIKLKRESIESIQSNSESSIPTVLTFSDINGVTMEIPIINIETEETPNPNVLSVTVTAIYPIRELYRIHPTTHPDDPMGY